MARMPVIPQPNLEGRPGGRVSGTEGPRIDVGAVEAPFESGARMAETMGNDLERLQEQRDAATAKLKKAVDGVTAERMAGDHSERARNLLDQLQRQYFDTPEKVPEEYRKQLSQMTDAEIKAAPNPEVGLDIAQKYAKLDDQQLAQAHSGMLLRMSQKAKSDLVALGNSQVRLAQSQTTLAGLSVALNTATETLDPHFKNVHANPEQVREKLKHDMTASWIEANGPLDPNGVAIAVDQAIKTKSGPLYDNLPAKELAEYQKKMQGWSKGYGERQRSQVAAEAVDFNTKTLDLFHSKDLDTRSLFQMRDELQRKLLAIKHNPQYKDNPDEVVKQSEVVQTQLDTLDALRDAAQQGGHWREQYDADKTARLFKRFEALGKSDQRAPNDLLKVLQVQRDLAQAQRDRWISPGDAETLTRSLRLMTGKQLSQQNRSSGSTTGPVKSPIPSNPTRQVGASALDALLGSGAYGRLTPEQKTQMRAEYHKLSNDAGENGRNVDDQAARKMALQAVQHVLSGAQTETEEQ